MIWNWCKKLIKKDFCGKLESWFLRVFSDFWLFSFLVLLPSFCCWNACTQFWDFPQISSNFLIPNLLHTDLLLSKSKLYLHQNLSEIHSISLLMKLRLINFAITLIFRELHWLWVTNTMVQLTVERVILENLLSGE